MAEFVGKMNQHIWSSLSKIASRYFFHSINILARFDSYSTCVFEVLFGPQTSGGGCGPRHAETSDGQGLQQLSEQNGEGVFQRVHINTMGSLTYCSNSDRMTVAGICVVWSRATLQRIRFATKPLSDCLLMLRDEHWKRVRSILTPAFSAAKMKEVRRECVHRKPANVS